MQMIPPPKGVKYDARTLSHVSDVYLEAFMQLSRALDTHFPDEDFFFSAFAEEDFAIRTFFTVSIMRGSTFLDLCYPIKYVDIVSNWSDTYHDVLEGIIAELC